MHLEKKNFSFLIFLPVILISGIFFNASRALSWSPYVICNDGAMVIDFEHSKPMKVSRTTLYQVVIRDAGVVNYFKSQLPVLGLYDVINPPSIFADNGEINYSAFNLTQLLKVLPPATSTDSYKVVLSREKNNGVKIEFFKGNSPLANWFFESCQRVNAEIDAYDPLDFWSSCVPKIAG